MSSQVAQETAPSLFTNLDNATRRYKLRDSTMGNDQVAAHLELEHHNGDHRGVPDCCFFHHGCIVAIRMMPDEVAIFHLWQMHQQRMEEIADRI